MDRRHFLIGSLALTAAPLLARPRKHRPIDLIEAPTNLGLRPDEQDSIPGTDRASAVLMQQGLGRAIHFRHRTRLAQLPYSRTPEPGTKQRNGHKIRAFNLALASAVERSRRSGGFPLVVGGECSDLLGGLLGLRRTGGRGLVHVDGHSDFLQPAFYPPDRPLHSAAGMDFALATGRGEDLLTRWPGIDGPLAADADVFQIGERYSQPPEERLPLFKGTDIHQLTEQAARRVGFAGSARRIRDFLQQRGLTAAWLHIDVDVLDKSVMPAVDSPGEPGLTFAELGDLLRDLLASGRFGGADVAIYDPNLDPTRSYARGLVHTLGRAFAAL